MHTYKCKQADSLLDRQTCRRCRGFIDDSESSNNARSENRIASYCDKNQKKKEKKQQHINKTVFFLMFVTQVFEIKTRSRQGLLEAPHGILHVRKCSCLSRILPENIHILDSRM